MKTSERHSPMLQGWTTWKPLKNIALAQCPEEAGKERGEREGGRDGPCSGECEQIKEPRAAAGALQAVTEPFVSLQPLNCTALDHRALMVCIFRNETLAEQTWKGSRDEALLCWDLLRARGADARAAAAFVPQRLLLTLHLSGSWHRHRPQILIRNKFTSGLSIFLSNLMFSGI